MGFVDILGAVIFKETERCRGECPRLCPAHTGYKNHRVNAGSREKKPAEGRK
jgi:hypothetical protein